MKKQSLLALAASVVAGGVLLRRAGLREDLDWEDVDKPGSIVDIDAYGVHYVEAGAGPAIVLLHGFGGHTYQFRKITPLFARDRRVISVDLKGFGYSERDPNTGLSHTDQVAMLKGLLDKLGVSRAVVLGHSMGGAVAMRFAATHPSMVDALVLAASVTGEERGRRRMPVPPSLLRPALPVLGKFAADRLLAASFYDSSLMTDELRTQYLQPARLRGSMDGLLKMMLDASSDGPIDFAAISMPVLLLAGADDRVTPLKGAQWLRERMPQARLVVIDRAAHLLLEERPEECAGAIDDFLREASVAAPAASRRDGA